MLSFQRVVFCSLGAFATLALSTGTASGSPILHYQVTTVSCFNCTTDESPIETEASYSGYIFEGVTERNGETDPSGNAIVTLGTLTRNNENYSQDETNARDFVLRVAFLPFGTLSGSDVFVARIAGTQGQPGDFNFDNPFRTYTFTNESGTGSFDFRINDILALSKNHSVTLTGTIQNVVTPTTVPEPASLLLLGSGLAVAARRFRRRATK